MQLLKKVYHRRRPSGGGAGGGVLSVPVDHGELEALAADAGVGGAPRRTGTLLKFTNVVKRWKRRVFVLENGVLVYSDEEGEVGGEKRRGRRKRLMLRRVGSKEERMRDVKGSINLMLAVVSPDDSDSTRFAIDVGHDVYHCRAEDEKERDEWVAVLNESKEYFRGLIKKAAARASERRHAEAEVARITKRKRWGSLVAPGSETRPQRSVTFEQRSDDSEDSILEDDGLQEAEESRKALQAELRRVLDLWRKSWIDSPSSAALTQTELVKTLAATFDDSLYSVASRKNPAIPRETAKGLMDLSAWCLHVLETNDEMYDRRLKTDLVRMMGNGVPVFPADGTEVIPLELSAVDDEDDSDMEFFDALSRASSFRSAASLQNRRISAIDAIFEEDQLPAPLVDNSRVEQQDQAAGAMRRVSTAKLSLGVVGVRTTLPPLDGKKDKLNIWGILKDSVGKDLSKISIPVGLNEPMSFLQRLAEDIEYSELLDSAATEPDPHRRMMYVAAMVVSHYSSTQGRVGKPFNPLLGESSELVMPSKGKGIRFIAEQVSHHPPVSACYAEGTGACWKYYNAIEVRNKFWGKSLEVFPTGLNHVEIPEYRDHYVFEQVTSCVHNLVVGRMWLDNYGEMEIVNRGSGVKCVISFNKTGWMSDSRSFATVKGVVYGADGVAKIKIGGNWTESVYEELPRGKRNMLWRVKERPPVAASQSYHMTKWAISLNQPIPADQVQQVAPTDSRLRPDQRALENGHYELAGALKMKLEDGQRERRRIMAANGDHWEPKWFRKVLDEETGMTDYRFTNEYFHKKAEGDWSRCPDLFSCGNRDGPPMLSAASFASAAGSRGS